MAFNRNFFMEVERSLDEMSDKRPLLPSGEYVATIGDYNEEKWLKAWEGKEKEDGTMGDDRYTVNIPCVIDITDDELLDLVGMPRFVVYYNLSLDVTDDGQIDRRKGKNWRLGALRTATQTNYSNFWFDHLSGRVVKVTVGTNTNPKGETNNIVTKVASID